MLTPHLPIPMLPAIFHSKRQIVIRPLLALIELEQLIFSSIGYVFLSLVRCERTGSFQVSNDLSFDVLPRGG